MLRLTTLEVSHSQKVRTQTQTFYQNSINEFLAVMAPVVSASGEQI